MLLLLEIQTMENLLFSFPFFFFFFWWGEFYNLINYQIKKPVTKNNTFRILPSMLLPKSATTLFREAVWKVNTLQELREGEISQGVLFFPYSYMLCWLQFSLQMWLYESSMNTIWVFGWYLVYTLTLLSLCFFKPMRSSKHTLQYL